jgi:sigma-B regulation protein RsbQ
MIRGLVGSPLRSPADDDEAFHPGHAPDDIEGEYVGGFTETQIKELLESLADNHMGWSAAMAPAIMGNPDRPELAEELTNSFCQTDPDIAKEFARVTFMSDNRADLPKVSVRSLVLQCREDIIASEEVGRYVNHYLPNSELVFLNATGHCPNLSAPKRVRIILSPSFSAWTPHVEAGGRGRSSH